MKKVWVGVEFGGDWEIMTATSLKDLAYLCEFGYRTALALNKAKKEELGGRIGATDGFMIKSLGKSWMVKESEVKKVSGRGLNFKKN